MITPHLHTPYFIPLLFITFITLTPSLFYSVLLPPALYNFLLSLFISPTLTSTQALKGHGSCLFTDIAPAPVQVPGM